MKQLRRGCQDIGLAENMGKTKYMEDAIES